LLAMVHAITLHKSAGRVRTVHGEEDRAALAEWAGKLGHASLHRLWQLLLKGHDEIENAPVPREACEMALLRALYAATLPDPGTLARRLADAPAGTPVAPVETPPPAAPHADESPPWNAASGEPVAAQVPDTPRSIADLVDMLDHANKWLIAAQVKTDMRLIELGEDRLIYQSATGRDDYVPLLREALMAITGRRWEIERGEGEAQPSLAEQEKRAEEAMRDEILNHPLVKATQAAFPDAEIDWTAAEISPHGEETLPTRSAKA